MSTATEMKGASQQLALGNGLAGKVLAGFLVCCQACDSKLPSPQDLPQGVEVGHILQADSTSRLLLPLHVMCISMRM